MNVAAGDGRFEGWEGDKSSVRRQRTGIRLRLGQYRALKSAFWVPMSRRSHHALLCGQGRPEGDLNAQSHTGAALADMGLVDRNCTSRLARFDSHRFLPERGRHILFHTEQILGVTRKLNGYWRLTKAVAASGTRLIAQWPNDSSTTTVCAEGTREKKSAMT
jgi:hypothetical protein